MPKAQQCETEDKECKCPDMCLDEAEDKEYKCPNTCRCGTGDTGCTKPPMNHMSSSMCNGVFKPVCAPEICNVPRIPRQETLVEGQGILLDTDFQQKIDFNILVEREMQVYRGSLELQDLKCDGIRIKADRLKFFEGDGITQMQAIFYEECTGRNTMVTVYKGEEGHQEHEQELTQIFIYSTSIETQPINLGGKVVAGEIKLYADHNVHGH